jgi:hypothetical protein
MQDVEPFLDRVKDSALHHSLQYGVGLITETQVGVMACLPAFYTATALLALSMSGASTALHSHVPARECHPTLWVRYMDLDP